jgi:hypothetical protein
MDHGEINKEEYTVVRKDTSNTLSREEQGRSYELDEEPGDIGCQDSLSEY